MTDSSEMFLFHGCSQEGDPWDSGQYLVELREGGFPSGAVIFISLVERHTYKPKQSLVLQQHLRYN